MRDAAGASSCSKASARDNTSLKQLEEIRQRNQERASLDRLKTQLLANVSHELRTPLVSIKGYNDLLLRGTLGPINARQRRGLEIAAANTQRLVELIETLLDLARREEGRLELSMSRFDLREAVAAAGVGGRGAAGVAQPAAAPRSRRRAAAGDRRSRAPRAGVPRAHRQRREVHRAAGRLDRRLRRSPRQLRRGLGRRSRHRHPRRRARAHLRALLPGRRLVDAPLRRRRPRPGAGQGAGHAARRRHRRRLAPRGAARPSPCACPPPTSHEAPGPIPAGRALILVGAEAARRAMLEPLLGVAVAAAARHLVGGQRRRALAPRAPPSPRPRRARLAGARRRRSAPRSRSSRRTTTPRSCRSSSSPTCAVRSAAPISWSRRRTARA